MQFFDGKNKMLSSLFVLEMEFRIVEDISTDPEQM